MSDNRFKHSEPISIPGAGPGHHRNRSVSFSASSSDDESNSPPLRTPSSSVPPPRIVTAQSPSTSPILSYFFQSPVKANALAQSPTSMFGSAGRGFAARPQEHTILEEDELEPSLVRHARRFSTSTGWTGSTRVVATSDQSERGTGLLRRLSLGNALVRPQIVSPPTQTSALPPAPNAPQVHDSSTVKQKKRRASLGVPGEGGRPRRSPSPMGERILKGHFDGFN